MKKVTIITPCYNGEKHLIPYLNALLEQTYTNVEYIFVNDGSNDKTEEIILEYSNKYKEKGWEFHYIKLQKNSGQAAAINKGLALCTGNYLSCIDSDDIILPDYIQKMSESLEKNPDVGIVFPWCEEIEESTFKHVRFYKRNIPEKTVDTLFDDILLQRDIGENAVLYSSYMLRSTYFFNIYKNKCIYEGLSGQNPQMILPIIYNYKTAYIKEVLYKCIARKNSDSRLTSVDALINKTYNWENLYCNVLKSIPNMPDYEKLYYFSNCKDYWQKIRENCLKKKNKRTKFFKKIFRLKK